MVGRVPNKAKLREKPDGGDVQNEMKMSGFSSVKASSGPDLR
jgi:hypothetical protein